MYPITVLFDDKSATSRPITGKVGATVAPLKKGPETPVLFYPKEESRIVSVLGIPEVGNEAVWDIIEYNREYPIYVSAPSTGGKHGGVLVKTTGSAGLISGLDTNEVDFANVDVVEISGTGDGVQTVFTKTVEDFAHYKTQSVDVLINGVSIDVSASDADPEVLTTTPDIGSGTFDVNTGEFSFTFTVGNEPAIGDVVSVKYTTDHSATTYFSVMNRNPQADDLKIKVTRNTNGLYNLDVKRGNSQVVGFPILISTVPGTKDGTGKNIYGPDLLKDNDFIKVTVNTGLAYSSFTPDANHVNFTGGVRGTCAGADLSRGWAFFQNKNKYKSKIFFDTTADPLVATAFLSLRNGYQKYSDYLLPLADATASNTVTAKTNLSVDNRGVKFFATTYAEVANPYTGVGLQSSLMGRVALQYARCADETFGAFAPAWFNTNGKWGGQLGSGINKLNRDWQEADIEILKAAKINPVILDNAFGYVITSQLTSQSLESDYSYQSHSGLADYLVENILNILPYQLSKPNDDSHRTSIKSQIETIMRNASQLGSNQFITAFQVKCDAENNNADVLSQRKFIVDVVLKFTPTSESIVLTFTNDAQGSTLVSE